MSLSLANLSPLIINEFPSNDQSPLLNLSIDSNPSQPMLCRYMILKLDGKNSRVDMRDVGCAKHNLKIAAIAIGIFCGYLSWYPLAQGVMNSDISYTGVKVILAGGSWASYGSLAAWGTLVLVRDLFKGQMGIEKELRNRDAANRICSLCYMGTITTLGISSCLPNAYFAWSLNNQNAVWPMIYIVGSFGVSAYSVHCMVEDFYIPRSKCLTPVCPESFYSKAKWMEVREFFALKVMYLIKKIPELENQTIAALLNQSGENQARESDEYSGRVRNIFDQILNLYKMEKETEERVETILNSNYVKYPVKIVSSILPISGIYIAASATFKLISQVTPNVLLQGLTVSLALSTSYLGYSLNRDGLILSIKKVAERVIGKIARSIAGDYEPKKRNGILFTATVVSLLSSALDYVVAREIFDGDTAIDWLGVSTSVASNVALTLLPMLDLSISLVELYVSNYGDHDAKTKLHTIETLQEICIMLRKCSEEEFILFVKSLVEKENSPITLELVKHFPWISDTFFIPAEEG